LPRFFLFSSNSLSCFSFSILSSSISLCSKEFASPSSLCRSFSFLAPAIYTLNYSLYFCCLFLNASSIYALSSSF
jgi:hypothetical protein